MATAAVWEEPSDTDCSICMDTYTEPKLLLCGHLLCRRCVMSWLTSKEDATCPLCRSTIMDAQSHRRRSIQEFVDDLSTDLTMKNIADAKRFLNKEHVCYVCEDVAATTICLTCRDMFCEACTKVNQKSSATKHHCVQTLASLTADELAAGSPSICHAHTNKASKSVPFSFHSKHGKNVLLRDDGRVADKQGEHMYNSIVISSQPMETNHLYEVEVRSLSGGELQLAMLIMPGVVTASPDHLTLPLEAYGWRSAIVISDYYTFITGKQFKLPFGQQLTDLSEGSRVGMSVDDSRNLLVHRDGECLGIVTHSVPHPAYALFDLIQQCKYSIAALPTTYLK